MPIKRNRPEPTGLPGVYKDGRDRFLVRVTWTCPKTGRRRQRRQVEATLEDAVSARAKLLGVSEEEKEQRLRLGPYVRRWLTEHKEEYERSTRDKLICQLAHAVSGLGEFYLDALEPVDVRRWRDGMREAAAPSTINGRLRDLKMVLDGAAQEGLIRANPARPVKQLKEGRTRGRRGTALSQEELRRFIETTQDLMQRPTKDPKQISADVGRLLLAAAWTGMRRAELYALKWEDVVDGEIRVQRAVYKRKEKSTKTDDPRLVAICDPLKKVFEEQRLWLVKRQHPGLASGLVFPADPAAARASATRRGTDKVSWYRATSCLNRPMRLVLEEGDLPQITLHSLRRTFEDLLRRAGVNQVVRKSLAGWRSDQAQSIYAGVHKSERAEAGEALVKFVLGMKGGAEV